MNSISLIIKSDEEDIEVAEVLVDGWIGDKKYLFLLDTGAARTGVELDNYTETFKCIEVNSSAGVFAKSNYDIIRIPNIKVGPIIKADIYVSRSKENITETRNLIGMDILKDYKFCFFFEKNMITVDQNHEFEWSLSLLELELGKKFHPYIDVDFQDTRAKAVWDTGAGITVVDINFIKKNPKLFKKIGQSIGTDSTGSKSETPMYLMEGTKIGNYEFAAHKVAGVDLSHVNSTTEIAMDMILGYTTLSKADWYFDFPNKKWAVIKLNNDN